ncbi:hypothetical protein QYF61_018426 [Mycteria americana]|uniref:Reverse transcriptase/retrotransposon-derived protein RNase H-like domain-containing protein n=1 Tax=Mycteria americana TaxID=33587 RepID=A0AAN7N2W1_MYCAM|nr:hypothetical protein QYF61_018426 [Mycteria americana]
MVLEQGEALEYLQYIDDITVWGNTAEVVLETGKKMVQILLKGDFAINQSKVKGPAQEIQFLGIIWQDGCHQIPMDVINKITAMSPPTSKKETQAFLGVVGFWRMYIPNYSLIVSPLYQVTQKKNDFKWGPEQQQAFEQIKRETVHAVALGPVQAGQDQDIAARVENRAVKVRHVDAHVPKSRATEEHQNNQQVDQAAKMEVAQVGLDWQHKGELFIARWAHDTSGHQGRDATYRWAHDQGVDLTMDTVAQVIHERETCPAIKQAKWLKSLWYGGRWLK